MSKPEVKEGQEWEARTANRHRVASAITRIRVLEVGTNRHEVATVTDDGRLIRQRELSPSALNNTPSGYCLVKDAPPEKKADAPVKACPHCHEAHSRLTSCWRKPSAPPSAPSPLEVVRTSVRDMLRTAPVSNGKVDTDALLATLEESIRAECADSVFAMLTGNALIPGRRCMATLASHGNAKDVADAIRRK